MKIQFSDLIDKSPKAPGVYKMYDAAGALLYVGKAKNLWNRLHQYTDITKLETHKQIMRSLVARVEWIITESEADALILEESLIKSEKPKYNIMLTDGKMYPHLMLTRHEFPRLMKVRGQIAQKKDVFGPYPSVGALNETIKQIQKVCGLRTCTDSFMRNRARPCLLHQIGRCSAPCTGQLAISNYQLAINTARRILTGDIAPVVGDLSVQMTAAAERQDYEQAAVIRDKIAALSETGARGIKKKSGADDTSFAESFAALENWLGLKLNRAAVFDNSHLFGKSPVGAMIVFGPGGFIKNEYRHFKLKDMARAGNDIAMMEEFLLRAKHAKKSKELRVESKEHDDTLYSLLSTLVIVDGGPAQWNIAHKTLPNIPVLGVVKGQVRNGDEHFILPNGRTDTTLAKDSPLFLLLRRVRDEAHRFAITFNRKSRTAAAFVSRLDEIEGIGAARKKALLHHFGTVAGVANANLRSLEKVQGLGKSAAKKIYSYFHPDGI
ncbi:MAG: excinuclease ABC subunit UvrC [Rickettsiales bacterium]|jgi:excinuclease UvrABC nuclease subunit|nr:excinuclease ABC subunit UvrC [Rickettsiales bacterium]